MKEACNDRPCEGAKPTVTVNFFVDRVEPSSLVTRKLMPESEAGSLDPVFGLVLLRTVALQARPGKIYSFFLSYPVLFRTTPYCCVPQRLSKLNRPKKGRRSTGKHDGGHKSITKKRDRESHLS